MFNKPNVKKNESGPTIYQNDQLLFVRVVRDVKRSDRFFEVFVSRVFRTPVKHEDCCNVCNCENQQINNTSDQNLHLSQVVWNI